MLAEEYFRIDNSWDESKHPRDERGRFSHINRQKDFVSDDKYSYLGQIDMMVDLGISEGEFMSVVSGINTLYNSKYKKEKVIKYYTMDCVYYAENYRFNNYKFYGKMQNNHERKGWG